MFNEILGNDKIKNELEQAIKLNKLSHSYLFLGTDGIGKKKIAEEFAKAILCTEENKYCNKCKSCIEFDSNNNPDYSLIRARRQKHKNRSNKAVAEKDYRSTNNIT